MSPTAASACRAGPDAVVITGVGVLTAAGVGLEPLSEALRANTCLGSPWQSALPVSRVAIVSGQVVEDSGFPDDRKAWLAHGALQGALDSAGVQGERPFGQRRVSVFLGTGLSSVTGAELEDDLFPHIRPDGAGGLAFDRGSMGRDLRPDHAAPRRHLPGRVTESFCRRLGATGPSGTSFSACAAASQAMAEGLWALRRGLADVAVVGGHDSMAHPMGLLSFVVLGALSPDRCRPFDRRRDGFMLGEGAAVFVLERLSDAARRGAPVYGVLVGAGTSVDAWNVTAPHPEGAGAELAMRRALRDAGLDASAIGYVNAHGTGTPVGDVAEAAAVHRVFGGVPISSVKGAVGHTIAAAGAVEAAACLAGLLGGFLPGTAGLDEPDPACPVQALRAPEPRQVGFMLSNSFGFGGQNASLVLAHPEQEVSIA